jgi:primosomal protein N' (replication factor Y)
VIVQTYAPEARPIVAAAVADVEGFYADELERRRALSYPPASTLIALHTSSPAADPVPAAGVDLAAAMRGALGHGEVVMGPGVVGRERGRYFCRCVIKTTEMGKTLPVVRDVVARMQRQLAGRGVRLMVDVEPVRL